MKRRELIKGLLTLPAVPWLATQALAQPGNTSAPLLKRAIPKGGELIPIVGLGTYQAFGRLGNAQQQAQLTQVLQSFGQNGGNFIDTSPMYSEAESVLGKLLPKAKSPNGPPWFLATKVWIDGKLAGVEQMESSASKMGTSKLDLIQIHNLRDWKLHLETLKAMKSTGKVRYIGATTWGGRDHSELEIVMKTKSLDFIQVSYNVVNRKIEQRILPLAKDLGIAVIVNRPFEQGALFAKVKNLALPDWASKELGCKTWAQVFLKFTLSDPRVTVVIPATSKPNHLLDNMAAGRGAMMNTMQREKLLALMYSR